MENKDYFLFFFLKKTVEEVLQVKKKKILTVT